MRKSIERYLVGAKNLSVYPANRPVFVEDEFGYGLNGILDNQIVIYNGDTGVSVGPGVTAQSCPNLVIAQGIDTDGDGVADVLRKPAFNKIRAAGLAAATADTPNCGAIKIIDVGIGCMERGKAVSLIVEARTDHTENFYDYNDFERWTETVEFKYDPCEGCNETAIPCKEYACALVNKFNGLDAKNKITKQGNLINRVRKFQKDEKPFHMYVLHPFDYEFCFSTPVADCVGCSKIPAITGIALGTDEDRVEYNFNLTTDPADPTKTLVGQLDRIIKKINEVLEREGKGYALNASTFKGTGKPCCDGVKMLVNTCVEFELLDDEGEAITPCSTGLPTHQVITNGECRGCASAATPKTPCAFIRVVAKPIELEKFADHPDTYMKLLYTDLRVTTSYNNNNIGEFYTFVKQNYEIPRNLAYQALHKVVAQDTSANEPFSWGYDEFVGKYNQFMKGSRTKAMLHGLLAGCDPLDTLCIYNFEHSDLGTSISVQGDMYAPRVRTTVMFPSSNVAARTEFEAIINPWIQSIGGFKSITCSVDQDQIERVLSADLSSVVTPEYPNANGKIIGG